LYEVGQIPEDSNHAGPDRQSLRQYAVIAIDEAGTPVHGAGAGRAALWPRLTSCRATTAPSNPPLVSCNLFASGRDEKLYCTGDWVTSMRTENFFVDRDAKIT